MGLVAVPNPQNNPAATAQQADAVDWIKIAAGGSLIVGGFLLLTGQRRAGMVAAASGTALALMDQQDALRSWWKILPGYVDQVQRMISQVQDKVGDIAARRESLEQVLTKPAEAAPVPAEEA
jgi:hypothetical protein